MYKAPRLGTSSSESTSNFSSESQTVKGFKEAKKKKEKTAERSRKSKRAWVLEGGRAGKKERGPGKKGALTAGDVAPWPRSRPRKNGASDDQITGGIRSSDRIGLRSLMRL